MNYYPNNYYLNYPYGQQQQYMPQQQQYIPQPQQQTSQALNGKIVDSADIVKATEVPMGGYGIFPKADLSEIYIKSWNNNGTTSVITYRPEVAAVQEEKQEKDVFNEIKAQIERLENKIDKMAATSVTSSNTSIPTAAKKEALF